MHIAAWCGDFDFVFTTVEAQRESDSCLPAACQLHPVPTTVTTAHTFINDHNRVSFNKWGASGGDLAEWSSTGALGTPRAPEFEPHPPGHLTKPPSETLYGPWHP